MLSLCNFLPWVNRKGACITYDSKLPIILYPIVLWRCPVPFLIPYITLQSIYNFCPLRIPYHLFTHILLLQHITYPPLVVHSKCGFTLGFGSKKPMVPKPSFLARDWIQVLRLVYQIRRSKFLRGDCRDARKWI